MTKKRSTKQALIASLLALVMCVSMLVGSTFAWFTDSVTSGNNKIVAGNLDVVLEYKTNWSDEWAPVDENTKIFKEGALYEPGYTEVVFLRVSNAGSLALKYNLMVNIASEKTSTNVNGDEFKLSDHLEIGTYTQDEYNYGFNYADILMPVMFGTREAALSNVTTAKLSTADSFVKSDAPVLAGDETSQVTALVLTMPETVGNEANHNADAMAPEINLGISLVATQYTDEDDSFDNQYDKDATYPVATAEELVDALTGGNKVVLANNISLDNTTITIPANVDAVIDLNGKTLSGESDVAATAKLIDVPSNSTLTISNGTVEFAGVPDINWGGVGQPAFPGFATNTIVNRGKLVIENATIVNNSAPGGASYAIDCYAGSSLTVNEGAYIDGKGKVAIRMFSASATPSVDVTINGGTIIGSRAIWVQLSGSNVNVAPDINLTINGGTLIATGNVSSGEQYYDVIYSYSYGNSFSGVDINITGGTFKAVDANGIDIPNEGDVAFGGGYKGDTENVNITGGNFVGDLGRYTSGGWVDITKP